MLLLLMAMVISLGHLFLTLVCQARLSDSAYPSESERIDQQLFLSYNHCDGFANIVDLSRYAYAFLVLCL